MGAVQHYQAAVPPFRDPLSQAQKTAVLGVLTRGHALHLSSLTSGVFVGPTKSARRRSTKTTATRVPTTSQPRPCAPCDGTVRVVAPRGLASPRLRSTPAPRAPGSAGGARRSCPARSFAQRRRACRRSSAHGSRSPGCRSWENASSSAAGAQPTPSVLRSVSGGRRPSARSWTTAAVGNGPRISSASLTYQSRCVSLPKRSLAGSARHAVRRSSACAAAVQICLKAL